SIANIVPAMDHLDLVLDPQSRREYHPSIRAVMKLACAKMNQYYELTDLSDSNLALMLHPGLKLEYFRRFEWEQEWIDNAETLTHKAF
ncbi:hypothetical protein EI94DRAFT_1481590, partial [Lactarius quietus]